MAATVRVPPMTAAHVVWHYDHSAGYEPGPFTRCLIEAIVRADSMNQARLALGFPDYVRAVQIAQQESDGLELLARESTR